MIINQSPPKFSPAYNETVYVVSSSNASQPNYKYICDIYAVDGTTRLARIKRIPQPDGYGLFDLHRILENYVGFDINASTSGIDTNTKSFYGYVVKFGEEYGAATSGPVQYLSLVTDSKRYIYNAVFDYPDFVAYNQTDWLIATASQNKFLSNAPRTQHVRPGTNAWLHYMADTNIVYAAVLKTYDATGTLIHTSNVLNTLTDMSIDGNKFLRFPAGPANAGTMFSETLDGSIDHYTIHLEDSSSNPVSEPFTFIINTKGTKFTWYRLHFLNKMGGFDSFDFRQMSRNNLSINRLLYKKYAGMETTGAWDLTPEERGYTQYDTDIKEKISINSDWITDEEAAWLGELFTSPAIYLERADNSLVAINIETADHEIQKKANDKLISIQAEFSYAFDKVRQRG
jgi:hypothetical protein